jgi:hypothetical protein
MYDDDETSPVEDIISVIENYTREEFEASGLTFTWKAVAALVAHIRELELELIPFNLSD